MSSQESSQSWFGFMSREDGLVEVKGRTRDVSLRSSEASKLLSTRRRGYSKARRIPRFWRPDFFSVITRPAGVTRSCAQRITTVESQSRERHVGSLAAWLSSNLFFFLEREKKATDFIFLAGRMHKL